METLLYTILLIYFVIGSFIIYFTNKYKDSKTRKYSWKKYFVYLMIINVLFFSILIKQQYFVYVSLIIIITGFYEIIYNTLKSKKLITGIITILIFIPLSYLFFIFSFSKSDSLFYSLFIVTVFDAFSQLIGQLTGKRKLFPKISPNKTYEGLLGGLLAAVITSILIRDLLNLNLITSIIIGLGISSFAFIGDFLASYTKRKYGIKDFSNLLPGHGGFLDRFDSLIMGNIFTLLIINSI